MVFVEAPRNIAAARLGTDRIVASASGLPPSSCVLYANMRMGTLIGGMQDESRGSALSLRPRGRGKHGFLYVEIVLKSDAIGRSDYKGRADRGA